VSSWLIQRGWPVGRARKAVVVVSAIGMTALSATVLLQTLPALVACFAVATFSYAALSTMILILPADVFPSESVATVSGLGGTGAGVGTIAATYMIGRVADSSSFAPVMVTASLVPLVAMGLILALVRSSSPPNGEKTVA
jgi:ACS family hexuronate transporter-like MFS transporter